MAPSSQAPTTNPELSSPVPDRPYVQVASEPGADPHAVRAALDELDATVRRREERRRAATRELVAELYARDGVTPAPGRIDAEAEAACAQEHDERLAAELRRLVTPPVAAIRQARTLGERELDGHCQAALNVLGTAPRSLAEFQPAAEQRHAAEQAVADGYARREAEVAGQLEEARGWQRHRQRRLHRELAEVTRGYSAAEHRLRAAARLAAVQLREAQRAEWLARSEVGEVLGAGAAALRELADRAQLGEDAATAELPAVAPPVAPGRPGERRRPGLGGCGWRRCSHPTTVVVSFQVPHPLAGTSRGYCAGHAAQVAGQRGAVLTGVVGRVPVQQALPGLDVPAEPGWPPARGGGR